MQAFFKFEEGTGRILGIYNEREPGTVWFEVNPDVGDRPWMYKRSGTGIIQTDEFMNENKSFENKIEFKAWRGEQLAKYDILGLCVARGDKDPKTGEIYGPITEEEKNFRVLILNFTGQITSNTTAADYPSIPTRLRDF